MTVEQFENLLVTRRLELSNTFHDINDVKDLDVYFKSVLDYQEFLIKNIFNELVETQKYISKYKGDILKDIRERQTVILERLEKIEKKLNEK